MPSPSLTLRPWALTDAPHMARLVNNPAVWQYLAAALPTPYTEEHARAFIKHCLQQENMMERAIVCNGEIAGTIGATLAGSTATIGYWLGEAWWRQGIMSNALPRFSRELPASITLLQARVFDFNLASQALLRRCGFSASPGTTSEPAQDGKLHPVQLWSRAR